MATAEPRTAPPIESNGQPARDEAAAVRKLAEARERIKHEVGRVIVGQSEIIDLMLVSLLCRGHVLLHGVPGLGKTLMGKTLADTLAMEFRRVQFTPDLMPSDITGTDIIKEDPASGRHALWVAKEEQAEQREQEAQPGEPVRQQQAQDERDYAAESERPPGAMRRGQDVANVVGESHAGAVYGCFTLPRQD